MQLQGRRAVITGANRGLGREIAAHYVKAGASVLLTARDGKLLDPTQTLASNVDVSDFQDVEGFLKNGGQRGPQRRVLREGTYAINLVQFIVLTDGRVYSLPLSREDMDDYALRSQHLAVASQGGAPTHPAWYANLVADPHVELQDGPHRRDMTARELGGAERQQWWQRAVEAFPPYAEYQEKTERRIPVFIARRR